ncbi:putative double-stranded RNA/RNA-DNA hybrid binding protein [Desulfitobacterium dehalogenans ATCC 51507]|uniref:Ribonuclease H n=1 Tax=Desulfitobacterium dehalogenans (strain ATCC 51507 / DSM 9161 / JW/IU-DC1) TaxID=756499 RepID=I4A9U5_DESDJ|nr:ribonuclease H family protein [Desulfitobacterium dehalogenans]AFM00730.1 putative double-stranded RNA/RNA-DNA hybrid binding protein [Desulfitobacterium dehalogenans ATCC 51507]
MGTQKPKFYAVRAGRDKGVFSSWEECKKAIHGFSGAVYRSFTTLDEAQAWFNGETFSDPLNTEDHSFIAEYDVYTDGSYVNGQYAWAYAFVKNGKVHYEDADVGKNSAAATMRNVAGEIAAALYAVKKASQLGVKIRIFHDYAGIAFWATGEWKAKNEFTQAYAKMMNQYRGIYSFEKVKAHSGDEFNDYVDIKAKSVLGIAD